MSPPPPEDAPHRPLRVRVVYGSSCRTLGAETTFTLDVKADGSDSILDIKCKIAQAAGGAISADDILLAFGPNDRKLGRQYKTDPTVDESKLLLSQFSILEWLQRFPHWSLTVRLLPAAPPPPGVAIKRAAAIAEQQDPDRAVQDGRAKGEIPKINDLPAPWGPKPFTPPPADELVRSGYLPAKFPAGYSPLVDCT